MDTYQLFLCALCGMYASIGVTMMQLANMISAY